MDEWWCFSGWQKGKKFKGKCINYLCYQINNIKYNRIDMESFVIYIKCINLIK